MHMQLNMHKKEILANYVVQFYALHMIICDQICKNTASTHTKSNLRFYRKWIAGSTHHHIFTVLLGKKSGV